MLIECLIKRDGPTHVTIAGFDYVFIPNEERKSVCEVMSSGHQAHFLALKDYVEYVPPRKKVSEIVIEEQVESEVEPTVYLKKSGEPYATETGALASARHHNLKEYSAVKVPGGFGLIGE